MSEIICNHVFDRVEYCEKCDTEETWCTICGQNERDYLLMKSDKRFLEVVADRSELRARIYNLSLIINTMLEVNDE